MNDNEIIKALECCRNNAREDECKYCLSCPMAHCELDEDEELNCMDAVPKRAIDLINQQKAENTELQRENAELQYENLQMIASIKNLKSEAIKEFAERLCEGRVSNDPVVIAVKVELEEMTEAEK